jgi:rhodanese-related sulfurtransferase
LGEELEISAEELKRLLDRGVRFQLIDVREEYEYDFCHIEGSQLIPMGQIQSRISEFNRQKDYVFYCHVGVRSRLVVSYLRKLGFRKVRSLRGGIDQWALEIDESIARY